MLDYLQLTREGPGLLIPTFTWLDAVAIFCIFSFLLTEWCVCRQCIQHRKDRYRYRHRPREHAKETWNNNIDLTVDIPTGAYKFLLLALLNCLLVTILKSWDTIQQLLTLSTCFSVDKQILFSTLRLHFNDSNSKLYRTGFECDAKSFPQRQAIEMERNKTEVKVRKDAEIKQQNGKQEKQRHKSANGENKIFECWL